MALNIQATPTRIWVFLEVHVCAVRGWQMARYLSIAVETKTYDEAYIPEINMVMLNHRKKRGNPPNRFLAKIKLNCSCSGVYKTYTWSK